MPSSHLILCRPLLLLPPIPPSIRVFSNESTLCMRWPKYWSFSVSVIPSKEYPGLISLQPKGLSRVFSNTTVQKHQFLGLSFLHSPTLTSIHDHWKDHIHNWVLFLLWLHPFILSGVISPLISCSMLGTSQAGGDSLSVSYHFAFSYCSWDCQGKNTEVVCHSLLQWTTLGQTSPPRPSRIGWPHGHGLISLS